jgi:hypothetical protein
MSQQTADEVASLFFDRVQDQLTVVGNDGRNGQIKRWPVLNLTKKQVDWLIDLYYHETGHSTYRSSSGYPRTDASGVIPGLEHSRWILGLFPNGCGTLCVYQNIPYNCEECGDETWNSPCCNKCKAKNLAELDQIRAEKGILPIHTAAIERLLQ